LAQNPMAVLSYIGTMQIIVVLDVTTVPQEDLLDELEQL